MKTFRSALKCASPAIIVIMLCGGCVSMPPLTTEVARISQPPPGKSLVNFHRHSENALSQAFVDQTFVGSFAGLVRSATSPGPAGADGLRQTFAIFDESGKVLIDLPPFTLSQFVCDPGSRVFIGSGDSPSVVQAELGADKVYDIMVDVNVDLGGHNICLAPLSKTDKRRQKLAQFEREEKATVILNADDARIADFETSKRAEITKIKADFMGGSKSDKVQHLKADDCR